MDVREYAEHLLIDCGCNLDCYKGDFAKHALPDMLEYAKENEVPFTLDDVAEALIAIGNDQPEPPRKGHKRFCMVFDVGHSVDGVEFDTFEEARNDALYTLEQWIVDEQIKWSFDVADDGISVIPHPSEEQIDSWDRMINDCCVYVVEWDDVTSDWEDVDNAWFPSSDDEDALNWLEWSELKKKYRWN